MAKHQHTATEPNIVASNRIYVTPNPPGKPGTRQSWVSGETAKVVWKKTDTLHT